MKLKHNKPDIVVWGRKKICKIIEISCPADVNIMEKVEEKLNNYSSLICNLQIMYPHYNFKMVPIVKAPETYTNSINIFKINQCNTCTTSRPVCFVFILILFFFSDMKTLIRFMFSV